MKKSNTTSNANTNTTTTTMPNTLNINGVTIQLTEEQVAKLAASLMFSATTPASVDMKPEEVKTEEVAKPRKKSVKKAATVSEVESAPAQIVNAVESAAADDDKLTDFADFEVQIDGNKLSFTAPEGKFLAYKTARYALNNRLKAICKQRAFNCVYNDKVWAWELRTMLGKPLSKTKMATIKAAVEAPVTVAELEDVRDRWSKKSSR